MRENWKIIIFLALLFPFCAKAEKKVINKMPFFKIAKPEAQMQRADITAIELDSEFYDKTKNINSDLRLVDDKGNEIPFAVKQLMKKKTVVSRKECESQVVSLKKHKNNSIEIIIEKTDKKLTPDNLLIKTPNRNFEKQAAVWGGNDKISWTALNKPEEIVDYSEIIGYRKNSVNFDKRDFKYYKIVISNFSEERVSPCKRFAKETRDGKAFSVIEEWEKRKTGFKIGQIILRASVVDKEIFRNMTKEYQVKIADISEKKKKTIISIETQRQPLVRFKLDTDSPNFSRTVRVEVLDKDTWRAIARGKSFYSINVTGFNKKHNAIDFPESRFKSYRIIIENADSAPLKCVAVKASGNIYRCETLWNANQAPLKLFYGASLPFPLYDILEIMDKINEPSYSMWKLDEEQDNPEYKGPPSKPFHYKILFIIAIVLMVVALAWILVKNIGKIDSLENGES